MSSDAATEGAAQLCALCNKAAPKECGSCHNIRYCSAECQKADWTVHKIVCKSFQKVLEAPGTGLFRGIYFPEQGSGPRFVWLRMKDIVAATDTLGIDISTLDIAEDRHKYFHEWKTFSHSIILDRAIPAHTWSGTFLKVTEDLESTEFKAISNNRSVAVIDQELSLVNQGPIVFHAPYRNLDTIDFCNAVDILRWEHYRKTHSATSIRNPHCDLPSVRVNCLGDRHFCNEPTFVKSQMPSVVLSSGPSKCFRMLMGDLVDIPLLAFKPPPSLPWHGRAVRGTNGINLPRELNPTVPALHPIGDENIIGTIDVARRDGKDIHSTHIDALCQYFDPITNGIGRRLTQSERATVLRARASAEGFKAFWEKLKSEGKFAGVQSPYEV